MAKALLLRFIRGFIAGAVAAMATITISQVTSWQAVIDVLNNLAISAIIGGLSGGILALDKYFRWEDNQ